MKQQRKTIDSYISKIIEESVKSRRKALLENEEDSSLFSSDAPSDDKVSQDEEEKQKLKSGDIEVDDVVEKLNSIRSGKSFKDKYVLAALKKYFDDLDEAEKTALLAFLKGISQIVTGEVPGDKALEPSDAPSKVEMEKEKTPKKVTIKPTVVKEKEPKIEKSKNVSSVEDTSGPVPIKPKK